VDHIVPVDIYLPGCPPRPEMLIDSIVKLHDKIQNMKLGVNRERQVTELEEAGLRRLPLTAGSAVQTGAGQSATVQSGAVEPGALEPGGRSQLGLIEQPAHADETGRLR
jgi:coenzyme F420-reducing hydrogenase gamma subunit